MTALIMLVAVIVIGKTSATWDLARFVRTWWYLMTHASPFG
jgi:hypothetical protein